MHHFVGGGSGGVASYNRVASNDTVFQQTRVIIISYHHFYISGYCLCCNHASKGTAINSCASWHPTAPTRQAKCSRRNKRPGVAWRGPRQVRWRQDRCAVLHVPAGCRDVHPPSATSALRPCTCLPIRESNPAGFEAVLATGMGTGLWFLARQKMVCPTRAPLSPRFGGLSPEKKGAEVVRTLHTFVAARRVQS